MAKKMNPQDKTRASATPVVSIGLDGWYALILII